jgi:hypothetical protein
MSRATSSHFAKYFYDIYSEYITPCTVMIYTMSVVIRSRLRSYTPYARGLQSDSTEWIILWMTHKEKLANPFILFGAMNKFSCFILPIIHAYNAGISWLRLEDAALVIYPAPVGRYDSGCISWLWSHLPTSVDITTLIDERVPCLTTSTVKDFAWSG